MTDDEFGDMTPFQFAALLDRQKIRFRREEYLNGIVASMVGNYGMRDLKEPLKPEDFLLSDKPKDDTPASADPRDMLRAFMRAFPNATHIGSPDDVLNS